MPQPRSCLPPVVSLLAMVESPIMNTVTVFLMVNALVSMSRVMAARKMRVVFIS